MDLKGKKLIVLTGCNGANDILEYAKKMGVYTIATDYNELSPVKDMADCRYNISTTDVDAIYEIAKNHKVDGLTTGTSEASMFSILHLSKRLNLPFYATEEQLATLNNKKKFKELLNNFDIPVPKEYIINGRSETGVIDNIEYPIIVKPVDSSGAKGISVCREEKELNYALDYALKHSRSKQVLIEKYMKGLPEAFFNYTIIDGQFSLSCAFDIYRNYELNDLLGLPVAYLFPSKKLQSFINTIHPKIISALKSIGIKNGTMSIQCFVDGDNFYVFEAGYRLGGAQMYIFTNELTGINTMEMMVNYALIGKMTDDPDMLAKDNPFFERPCCQLNIPLLPGKIARLDGIEEIKKINGILNVTEVRKKGDLIESDCTTNQLSLRIHMVADSKKDLSRTIDEVNSRLFIEDEKGNDMFLERYSLEKDEEFFQV
jgi:carbamoylphosphate synthase large subunit